VGAGAIGVFPDDLARAVDAVRFRDIVDVVRIDDERIAVANFDEAELLREVDGSSDDLAQVVDAVGEGVAAVCVGIVEVGVTAAGIDKPMRVAVAGSVRPDHLPRGVRRPLTPVAKVPLVAEGSSRVV
jgi:hypothetical protein